MKTKYYYIFSIFLIAAIYGCNEDTLDLERIGSVTGKVLDKETGEPIQNAKISTNPASTTTFTNESGEFSLLKIVVDNYSIQAEEEDYRTGFEPVNVVEDGIAEVVINLEKKNTENQNPTQPELIYPEDGAENIGLQVEFIWQASDPEEDDIYYTLNLRNGTTSEMQEFEIVNDTSFTVNNLNLSTRYFWQVSAKDDGNEVIESSISEFKTITALDNPYFFVKKENGNNVIYSGDAIDTTSNSVDQNLFKVTSENANSFRPRKNNTVGKIAFLRTVGGDAQLFTINLNGTNITQVTANVPVGGFRLEEITYTWSDDGAYLYYPNFDKLYRINNDGSNRTLMYQTADGSLISEVEIPDFDTDLLLLKTNNYQGYNVRLFTYRLSTNAEETVILDNIQGAAGSIDITADANKVLYSRDVSQSQNQIYRQFEARMFVYDMTNNTTTQLPTDAVQGQNEYHCRFSPTEGGVIFTRVNNNFGASPVIFSLLFSGGVEDNELFTEASMPEWQ